MRGQRPADFLSQLRGGPAEGGAPDADQEGQAGRKVGLEACECRADPSFDAVTVHRSLRHVTADEDGEPRLRRSGREDVEHQGPTG